jgi:hypothetical protein
LPLPVPLTLIIQARPLIAWRYALLGLTVGPWQTAMLEGGELTVYLPLAPVIYLYFIGLDYDDRVLSGARGSARPCRPCW